MDSNPITAPQSKWARNSLSLSQADVARLASKAGKQVSLSRLKVFEAGYFRPGEEFARELRELYEARGVDFRDFGPQPEPASKPVPAAEGGALATQLGRRPRPCFYFDPALSDVDQQRWFDAIEANQARVHELCEKDMAIGRDGELSDESLDVRHELLNCLALDSLMLRMLIGANPVQPRKLDRNKARKLRDAVGDFFFANTSAQPEATEEGEPSDDASDEVDEGEVA